MTDECGARPLRQGVECRAYAGHGVGLACVIQRVHAQIGYAACLVDRQKVGGFKSAAPGFIQRQIVDHAIGITLRATQARWMHRAGLCHRILIDVLGTLA
jgi:hypothetical protein